MRAIIAAMQSLAPQSRRNLNTWDFTCDWRAALNLRGTVKGTVGYLLHWSGLGGLNLTKDIEVWNPFNSAGQTVVSGPKVPCVGLLERFTFEGDEEDPIRMRAWVSRGTAMDIRAKLARPLTNTKLKLAWYLIDSDESERLWFETAFLKTPQQAEVNLDSAGGELQIRIDPDSTRISEELDIHVYAFDFQVVPAEGKSHTLEFASGPTRRLVKTWGTAG